MFVLPPAAIKDPGVDDFGVEDPGPVVFEAELRPRPSLSKSGFRRLMVASATVSAIASGAVYSLGAWPVIGFMGADLLLLYWAFKISYRAANRCERLRLTPYWLTIQRFGRQGQERKEVLRPHWLRVEFGELPGVSSSLHLWSHGRSTSVGSFLPLSEQERLAVALCEALERLRLNSHQPGFLRTTFVVDP